MKMEGNSNFQFGKKLKWNGMEWKEIATPILNWFLRAYCSNIYFDRDD